MVFLSHVFFLLFWAEPIDKQVDSLSNSTRVAMSCDTVLTEGDQTERKDCKKVCSESGNIINLYKIKSKSVTYLFCFF